MRHFQLRFVITTLAIQWTIAALPDQALAQDSHASQAMRSGAWALQFEINAADLDSFQGAVFSGKYHLSRASALRFGLGLELSSTDDLSRRDYGDGAELVRLQDRSSTGVQVALQYVYYLDPGSDLSLYLLGGVYGGGNVVSSTSRRQEGGDVSYYDMDNWNAGVGFGLGVEWFLSRHLSLLAQYQSSARYSDVTFRSWRVDPSGLIDYRDRTESDTLRFGGDDVRFGLSIYL